MDRPNFGTDVEGIRMEDYLLAQDLESGVILLGTYILASEYAILHINLLTPHLRSAQRNGIRGMSRRVCEFVSV